MSFKRHVFTTRKSESCYIHFTYDFNTFCDILEFIMFMKKITS